MRIVAKYASRCERCGQPYAAGETIEWNKAEFKGGRHLVCPQPADDGVRLVGGVDGRTREGWMLSAGRLTVTITNPEGRHVTLQLTARRRGRDGWEYAPVSEAQFIFVKRGNERVATLSVKDGVVTINKFKTDQVIYRAIFVLWQHMFKTPLPGYKVVSADQCGCCGRPLTDPESIERGLGPSCYGKATKSKALGSHEL